MAMAGMDEAFLKRLLSTFRMEADEHIRNMTSGLIDLEKALDASTQAEITETVFREAHSLKGAARAVNLTDIEAICQAVESVFACLKRREIPLVPLLFDILHQSVDLLTALLAAPDGMASRPEEIAGTVDMLAKAARGEIAALMPATSFPESSIIPASPVTGQDPVVISSAVSVHLPPSVKGEIRLPSTLTMEDSAREIEPDRESGVANPSLQSSPSPAGEETGVVTDSATPSFSPAPLVTEEQESGRAEPPAPLLREGENGGVGSDSPVGATLEESIRLPRRTTTDTVRISLEKLDALLRQSEELLSLKLIADRNLEGVRELTQLFRHWDKQWSNIYPVIREFRRQQEKRAREADRRREPDDRKTIRLVEFSETLHDHMKVMEAKLAELRKTVEHNFYASAMMVENLVGDVKQMLMLPFSTLFEAFPKLIRDLSRDQDKEVDLVIRGEEIEIDRRILEEIKSVFIHLLRNAVDHGIEMPQARKRAGKSPRGTINLTVFRSEGNQVEVLLADDGDGVDVQALKKAALMAGDLSQEDLESMTESEILSLAFQSGVSTSEIITDLSGRGLGLAIVREKVEKLGGQVAMTTEYRAGTTFRIALPLTLSTSRGVLVKVAERLFIIPTANLTRVIRIRRENLRTVENRETLVLDGITLPLVKLADILEFSGKGSDESAVVTVLILESQDRRIGFSVEEIVGEQEVILKSFRPPLSRIRNVAAATILGSGKVVPVLNVADLIKSAALNQPKIAIQPAAGVDAVKKSILVVEDSITSRMLLKNILETAGYLTVTAVDGVDALTRLKTESFDAVISDVDMPRMNGFNLTEKIRGDRKLAELPVILVTSLGSREDRERGIDVGANAYIIKSSFDQSNLLETLRRLL